MPLIHLLFLLELAFAGVGVNFLATSVRADTSPPESLLDGPVALKQHLGESLHFPIQIKHPAHARLLFVNFPALRKKGIALPEQGMTPSYENRLNNVFLWVVVDTDNPADYAPGENALGLADLYGGGGGIQGYGSGRAFTKGLIQFKFAGRTGLSPNNVDFGHWYGRGPLSRAFSEVLWGEVGQDFPWGANRVLSVADRGTSTIWPNDGSWEREGLLSREDPERPAHGMPILGTPPEDGFPMENKVKLDELDAKRVPEVMRNLLNVLPQPANLSPGLSPEQRFESGTFEFLDRWADQKSFEVANRFFYASTSPSNMEWDGKLLDFDTMTAQPSYMTLRTTLDEVYASNRDFEVEVIEPLFRQIHLSAPQNFNDAAPSAEKALAYFRSSYDYLLARNFVELTGIPRDVVLKLEKEPNGKKLITDLGKVIEKTAFHGTQDFIFTDTMPEITTTYDLPRILVDLASRDPTDPKELNPAIEEALPNPELRKQLVDAYSKLMSVATHVSAQDGVSIQGFQTMIYDNSKMRNADIPEMSRPTLRWDNIKLVEEYLNQGQDRSKVWDSINARAARSRRVYRGDHPYQLVLAENEDALNRTVIRHVFDAKENRYQTVVQLEPQDGKVSFFGKDISLNEIAKTKLWSDNDNWSKGISPRVDGTKVEFKLPADADTSRIEFALRPADGKKSWKGGVVTANIVFTKKGPLPWHPATYDSTLPVLKLVPSEASEAKVSDSTQRSVMIVSELADDAHSDTTAPTLSKSKLNSFGKCFFDRLRSLFH